MDQLPSRNKLCKRCRRGLLFPGIEHPLAAPETVLQNSSLAKTEINPHGTYSQKYGQHRLRCDFVLKDLLPELPTLARTVSKGCGFCQLLQSAIVSTVASRPVPYDAVQLYLDYFWDSHPARSQVGTMVTRWVLQGTLMFHDPTIGERRAGLPDWEVSGWVQGTSIYWPLARQTDGLHGLRLQMPNLIQCQSLEDQALSFLQSNIRDCASKCVHDLPISGKFVPHRLIDVREDHLRIIETEGDPKLQQLDFVQYATLSYCWGTRAEGLTQLRLTSQSKAQLTSGILLGALSPVQKDAVVMTRALGIPYLWIDALCIMQNDAADWERESALMHKIYGNSYVTLCNLRSQSCQQGFISGHYGQVSVPFDTMARSRATERYQIGPGVVSGCSPRAFEKDTWARLDFDSTEWDKRAWTFQEGVMSTRMIFFAHSGLYFSCSKGLVWEYGRVREEPLIFSLASVLQHHSRAEIYRRWNLDIVRQFSGRKATYLTDSLPALSGVAQMFAAVLNDEYVAGLWKHDLLSGLMWKVDNQASSLAKLLDRLSLQDSYIGPSWSWIGKTQDGHTVCEVRGFGPGCVNLYPARATAVLDMQCDTIETHTVPTGMDKFGKISGAALLLTTRVYSLALGCCPLPTEYNEEERLSDTGNFCLEPPWGGTKLAFSYCLDFFPNPDINDPGQSWKHDLTLVLIGCMRYEGDEDEESEPMPYGLIVHQATVEDTYWRVGTFGPPTVEHVSELVSDLDSAFFERCEMRSLKII